MNAAGAPLLRVEQLSAGYGDIRATWDVSFDVHPGAATVVLGRNGAGKSTTLLTIAGLLKAKGGSVHFDGQDITGASASQRTRAGLALVQENKRVFRSRTVEQNLLIGGYTLGRRARRDALATAYERFPMLVDKRGARAGALSGGQQQMLAIAQALMPGPRVLMLDEPSAGLAPVIVKDVLRIVKQLRAEGLGIVLVEQLLDQALEVADEVVVLDQGRVVLRSNAAALTDTSVIRDVYLGGPQRPNATDVGTK